MPVLLQPTRDNLMDIARRLPPAAAILSGLCELLHDVNTDLDQLAEQIRLDAVLSARVVRVGNSVVFGGRGAVASVEEALGRVGFAEVMRLVGTASVSRLVERALSCYHLSAEAYRESLLMHAIAAEQLAEAAGLERNAAYVAGLVRGIGPMVLDRFAGQRLGPSLTFDPATFETYRDWENERFGLAATRVTAMALDEWRFPEETVRAIELHLDGPEGNEEVDRMACVLNLAGGIALQQNRALPGEQRHWTVTAEKLELIGIDEFRFGEISSRAAEAFEHQRQALF